MSHWPDVGCSPLTRSIAEVDLAAIRHNATVLRAVAPDAQLCAVVKADAYGHGEVEVARAAIAGGASLLAVARVREGVRLRAAGFDTPIWVLSEPEQDDFDAVAECELEPAVYTKVGIEAAIEAARSTSRPLTVHLKIDTGMHRVGAAPDEAVSLAQLVSESPYLVLGSVWTHCAVADQPADPFTDVQLDRFDQVRAALDERGIEVPLVHAANSGATIAFPRSRLNVVRCGIALYGMPPSDELDGCLDLRPALRWTSSVSFVKRLVAGERVSYGLRTTLDRDATVATIPVGYADGYSRSLWDRPGHVLVGGRKRDILGVVTMDQMVVDVGDDDIRVGDEVVLIGQQGDSATTAGDLAAALGTINYEITCGITLRVERTYVGGGT